MDIIRVFSMNLKKYRTEMDCHKKPLQTKQDFIEHILVLLSVEKGALH